MEGRIENHGNKKGCKEKGRKEEETLVLLRPNRGGRASVPFFFALCYRSVTPVVFTSRLSLGQCGALAFCRASQIKPCTRLAEEFWPGELFDHRLRASSGALARAITKRPCKQGL